MAISLVWGSNALSADDCGDLTADRIIFCPYDSLPAPV